MTKQWQNRYITEKGEVILSPYSPFSPSEYGISPTEISTGCRRGYVCEFRVKGSRCVLDRLLIRMRPLRVDRGKVHVDDYPPINGQLPRPYFLGSGYGSWLALYENIGLEFDYSLKELSGRGLMPVSSINHFPAATKNRTKTARSDSKSAYRGMKLITRPPSRISYRTDRYYYNDPKTMGYDIIGDIHGHADELESLLEKLGYSCEGRCRIKRRRIIFVGDFIDRGPKNKRVIDIIRTLVRKDLAYAIMGNHEYNAICYHTKSKIPGQDYLREHNDKNNRQHEAFLRNYPDERERDQVIRWFQRLPLFLDLEHFRVVHACWDQEEIDFVETHYQNYLTDEFLHKSVDDKTREHQAIEILLKGPEYPLKPGVSFLDTDLNPRCNFRLKWWEPGLKTLGAAAMIPEDSLLKYRNDPLSDYAGENPIISYPKDVPPVIFGHYSKKSFGPKAACLDYGIIKGKELAALRWYRINKDKPLSEMEIVKIPARR